METKEGNKEIMYLEIIWKYPFPKLTQGVKVIIRRSFTYLSLFIYDKLKNALAIKSQI